MFCQTKEGFAALDVPLCHAFVVESGWSGTATARSTFRYRFDNAHLPYWFLLLLFASGGLPLILQLRARQRRARRLRLHQCLSCGYALRGTPDRCPECGAASPAKASA